MIFPKVSIILPIYNGEKTLKKTLESLLNQSYSNFELIACIDGTCDGSENILKTAIDNRIKILKNPKNIGLGRTLNKLINSTDPASVYIAMAEQDDWYYPYKLEKQVAYMEENPDVGLVSGIAEHNNGTKIGYKMPGILAVGRKYPKDPIEMFKWDFREGPKVVQTCMMFRKKVHIDNGLYFSQHFHTLPIDWLYTLRFSLVAPIHGLNIPLVIQDRRNERTSITKNKKEMYRGSRELIGSIYFEFSHILSENDYRYTLINQYCLKGKMNRLKALC